MQRKVTNSSTGNSAIEMHGRDNMHSTLTHEEEENGIDEDEIELAKLQKNTVLDDFILAIYESRLIAPIVALVAIFLSYHLTIAPHRVTVPQISPDSINLPAVRPVLTPHEQAVIQNRLLHAETNIYLPPPRDEFIHFKFHQSIDKYGTFRLPTMFYTGVTFGLTVQNPHNVPFTGNNAGTLKELKHELHQMYPKPTHIMRRAATYANDTDIVEDGYAVFFSYQELENQGKLSSDTLQPWKRISEDILSIARQFRQIYVTVWYPHQFGHSTEVATTSSAGKTNDKSGGKYIDKYRYYSLLQQIIPTRTGLNGIKSTSAVWLTAVNGSEPSIIDHLRNPDW